MSIEVGKHGSVAFTGSSIEIFRLMALRQAMRLEVRTGIKATAKGNPFKICREEFGIKARKKELVLAEFEALLASNGI
jgi:hypothetical protein